MKVSPVEHQSASEHRRNKRIDKFCLQNLQTFITPSPTLANVGEVAGQIPFPLRKGGTCSAPASHPWSPLGLYLAAI